MAQSPLSQGSGNVIPSVKLNTNRYQTNEIHLSTWSSVGLTVDVFVQCCLFSVIHFRDAFPNHQILHLVRTDHLSGSLLSYRQEHNDFPVAGFATTKKEGHHGDRSFPLMLVARHSGVIVTA
jgi:hypothetical protein